MNITNSGGTSYQYIVNVAVYNGEEKGVKSNIKTILDDCKSISDPNRKITVVIGINESNKRSAAGRENTLEEMVSKVEDTFKEMKSDNFDYKIVGYKWDEFRDKMSREPVFNEHINYVDIRNKLFYSTENLSAVEKMVVKAKEGTTNQSVKLLALDADTRLTEEKMQYLENHWENFSRENKQLPSLVTSFFYEMDFEGIPIELVNQSTGSLNWGIYLAKLENNLDRQFKSELKNLNQTSEVKYSFLKSPPYENLDQIGNTLLKVKSNLYVLENESLNKGIPKEKIENLKICYVNIISTMQQLKKIAESPGPMDVDEDYMIKKYKNNINDNFETIKTIEDENKIITQLKHDFEITGEHYLYPSENIMFVSLYDKIGALKSDLFETIEEKFSPRSSDPTKKILLWGNNLGMEV
ncbi:MAG: hypothetical protein H0U49_10235 [Parachlamydiaceae bacterium]|nr:hypothetical protein [Parachlamydiaceae bacterium]